MVPALWPVPGMSLQGRVDVALHPHFAAAQRVAFFCARLSRMVGPGPLGIERAAVLAESIREQLVPVAMQRMSVLCDVFGGLQVGWAGFQALAFSVSWRRIAWGTTCFVPQWRGGWLLQRCTAHNTVDARIVVETAAPALTDEGRNRMQLVATRMATAMVEILHMRRPRRRGR